MIQRDGRRFATGSQQPTSSAHTLAMKLRAVRCIGITSSERRIFQDNREVGGESEHRPGNSDRN
jgi:hypothetical protein